MNRKTTFDLENLLALDGDTYVIHEAGYWVKFDVKRVENNPARPHGIRYSLTLHSPDNERLIGFDDAHTVRKSSGPAGRTSPGMDHRHKLKTIRPYVYRDALKLIDDFWRAVDQLLKERTCS
ncbi:MAG: DUF6516 family protein [Acidobacteriaceae bacterium]